MAKPSIVIVPGSFATPGLYQDCVLALRAKGFPALEVFLPTTQKRVGLEPATMQEDAAKIKSVAEALIAQGKEVVVVCHSYGGCPTTEGLVGVPVKRIIYLTSIAPKVGESLATAMPIQAMLDTAVGGYMHSDPVVLAGGVGTDLPTWEEAFEQAQKLPHHSAVAFTNTISEAAYKTVPVSYILTEKDVVVSAENQEQYVKNIEEAKGEKISVIRKPWGHCPMWGLLDETIDVIVGEAEK